MSGICLRSIKVCSSLIDRFEGVGDDAGDVAKPPPPIRRGRSFSEIESTLGSLRMAWSVKDDVPPPSPSPKGIPGVMGVGANASNVFTSKSSVNAGSTIGSNTLSLSSAVSKLAYFESFRRFLQAESSEENLFFWLEAEEYRIATEELQIRTFLKAKGFPSKVAMVRGGEVQEVVGTYLPSLSGGGGDIDEVLFNPWRRLKQIYENYIKAGAPLMINLSSKNKNQVAKVVADKAVPHVTNVDDLPDPSILVAAQKEIFTLMKNDSYSRFKKSKFFKHYEQGVLDGGPMQKLLTPTPPPAATGRVAEVATPRKTYTDAGEKGDGGGKFKRRFDTGEPLILEEKAYLKDKVTVKGTVYITQGAIHFYGHVFGLKKKVTVELPTVTKLIREEGAADLIVLISVIKGKDVQLTGVSEAAFKTMVDVHTAVKSRMKMVHTRLSEGENETRQAGRGRSSAFSAASAGVDTTEELDTTTDMTIPELSFWSSYHAHAIETDHLTERDFTLILGGAEERFYSENAVVLREGVVSSSLYQVAVGTVRVEVGRDPTRIVRVMAEGDIFGEMSFLGGGVTTATIVADSPNVVVLEISSNVFEHFMKVEIGLAGRFHKFFGLMIVERLQSIWEGKKIAPIGFAEAEKVHRRQRHVSQLEVETTSDSELEAADVKKYYCWLWSTKGDLPAVYGKVYFFRDRLVFTSRVFHCITYDEVLYSDVEEVLQWHDAIQDEQEDGKAHTPTPSMAMTSAVFALVDGTKMYLRSEELGGELVGEIRAVMKNKKELPQFSDKLGEMLKEEKGLGMMEVASLHSLAVSTFLQYVHFACFGQDDCVYDRSTVPGLYQVVRGRIGVYREGQKLARPGAGELVGEASFLQGDSLHLRLVSERPYTVVALLELSSFMLATKRSSEIADAFYRYLATELVIRMKNGVVFAEF
uniref:cGMP-dependent protein kinase n=1 Tax=Palpitomonas bilix TaxID=652834 RepID=A0A7S3DGE8_9EUKA|mmetsp:Transcript_36244/g.94277  ORF Transcript_36244/g.94277 Transcript_36244/m.94277 type:complete len:924 (+) Transcript_36244:259-3030(+)